MYSCRVSGVVCYYKVLGVDMAKFVLLADWLTASETSLEFHFYPFYIVCMYIMHDTHTHTQKCAVSRTQGATLLQNKPSISIHGTTAPSRPWSTPQDASIHPYFHLISSILLSPAAVTDPSGPHPSIWLLVFPLGVWRTCVRLKHFCNPSSILTMWPAHPNLLINPLNVKLKPICHLLALLGAYHIFHVSGLRVNILHDVWLIARWQWLFYMYRKYEIGYYWI